MQLADWDCETVSPVKGRRLLGYDGNLVEHRERTVSRMDMASQTDK